MPCCSTPLTAFLISSQGHSTGNITLNNVICDDLSSQMLSHCSYDIALVNELRQFEELLVGCYEKSTCNNTIIDDDIRLVNGRHMMEGRVEVCDEGEWKAVRYPPIRRFRGDDYIARMAKVICRQLGYPWECKYGSLIVLSYNDIDLYNNN